MKKESKFFVKQLAKLLAVLFFFCNTSIAQKRLLLSHAESTKNERTYNMDGAEMYFINNADTFFLPKVNKYEFSFPAQLDSLVSSQTQEILFLIKTTRSIYAIGVSKDVWNRSDSFRFSFYKTPKLGSYSAITFESISGTSPAVIIPNKEWQRKFYK